MKTIKVYNNEHFGYNHITAVATAEKIGYHAYDNTIKVYSYGHSLVDILCEHKMLNYLMECENYSIEKYWNCKDVVIITIKVTTFDKTWEADCEEW